MSFSKQQWVTLSERFNSNSFTGKIILIKNNLTIFKLEYDGDGNFFLRLCDNSAMLEGYDLLFSFPQNLDFTQMRDLFKLLDLEIFKMP